MRVPSAARNVTSEQNDVSDRFAAGLTVGLVGYVAGGLCFAFLALILPNSSPYAPHSGVTDALAFAALVDLAPTVVVPVVGVTWLRQGRRSVGVGALVGGATGVGFSIAAATATLWIIRG